MSSESPATPPPARDPEAPHVPGLRSWRGVYIFVLACFAGYVALLALFTAVFGS